MSVHAEVLLASGYVLLLLASAGGLDRLARHTRDRSDRFRTQGFTYSAAHDHWVCPEDQYLWPQEYDAERRLIRYRAKPSVCNACPVKDDCTGSGHGREIVKTVGGWPHSEADRFHRGIALLLVALAGLLVVVELIRFHAPADLAVLGAVAIAVGWTGLRLSDHLRATPAGFPDASPAHGLRVDGARPDGSRRSRTRWGFDARRSEE